MLSLFVRPLHAQDDVWPWEGPYTPIPVHHAPGPNQHCCEIAHALLIGTGPMAGKVLLIQSSGQRWIWDPASPRSVGSEQLCDTIAPTDDMFCAGHSADGNGDLVIVGGARHRNQPPLPPCEPQPKYSYVYEAGAACWSTNYPLPVPNPPPPDPNNPSQPHPDFVNLGYYYPSTVRLPDGRVLFAGGGSDPVTSACNDPPGTSNFYIDGWMVLDRTAGGWLGPAPTQWFPGIPGSYQTASGATVQYDFLPFAGQGAPHLWNRERKADPVFFPECIDLASSPSSWTVLEPHVSPRLYHSAALLLPDGRVLVAGGYRGKVPPDPPPNPLLPEQWTWANWQHEHSDLEIYSPPYLFAGARPQILHVANGGAIGFGPTNAFQVTVAFPGQANPAAAIGMVALLSPGAVTHHYDWDNRFVKLAFSATAANKLTVVPPADGSVAPPGVYMLFVTSTAAAGNGTRIPSVAAFVHLQ